MPAAKKLPLTRLTGGADLAEIKLSMDQPLNTDGNSYVMPAVNACRMSKLEFPRSMFAPAICPGVLTFVAIASVEAISIECDHEYDETACRPRDKRR